MRTTCIPFLSIPCPLPSLVLFMWSEVSDKCYMILKPHCLRTPGLNRAFFVIASLPSDKHRKGWFFHIPLHSRSLPKYNAHNNKKIYWNLSNIPSQTYHSMVYFHLLQDQRWTSGLDVNIHPPDFFPCRMDQQCPKGWWGNPTCGPCNCDAAKGFDPDCNKTNGQCHCKVRGEICLFWNSLPSIDSDATYDSLAGHLQYCLSSPFLDLHSPSIHTWLWGLHLSLMFTFCLFSALLSEPIWGLDHLPAFLLLPACLSAMSAHYSLSSVQCRRTQKRGLKWSSVLWEWIFREMVFILMPQNSDGWGRAIAEDIWKHCRNSKGINFFCFVI